RKISQIPRADVARSYHRPPRSTGRPVRRRPASASAARSAGSRRSRCWRSRRSAAKPSASAATASRTPAAARVTASALPPGPASSPTSAAASVVAVVRVSVPMAASRRLRVTDRRPTAGHSPPSGDERTRPPARLACGAANGCGQDEGRAPVTLEDTSLPPPIARTGTRHPEGDLGVARLVSDIGGEPANRGEARVVRTLLEQLPDDYGVLPN